MRIGIDCRMYSENFTGIGRYTKELVDHLIAINKVKKYPHEFVLFFNDPEYGKFKTSQNVTKVRVNARHYSFAEQTKFLRILNKENLDLMHFTHFNAPIFYRKPFTVTIHDLTHSLFPGRKMTHFLHRFGYRLVIKNAVRKAKKVIAISKNTKKDIVEYVKVPESKIDVIYNGVNEEFKLYRDAKPSINTARKLGIKKEFLLYTGVWRYHKNLPNLVKAFAILRERGLDLQLVITGKPDPQYPENLQEVEKHSLGRDVIFPGLVPEKDLIKLYNAALFYVFPSLYEGFGLPPLEAMRCGTPVVASNTSCLPEVCGHENAIFFDPYDPEDIANKIESLYKDADLQAKLIERGLSHASKFTWNANAKQVFALLESQQ